MDVRREMLEIQEKLVITISNAVFTQIIGPEYFSRLANISARIFLLFSQKDFVAGNKVQDWTVMEYDSIKKECGFILSEISDYAKNILKSDTSFSSFLSEKNIFIPEKTTEKEDLYV